MKRIFAISLIISSLAVSHGQEANKPATEIMKTTPAGPVVKFTLGDFTRERALHDFDDDGWCDLWCAIFPDIEHRNKAVDTDKDGLTDYQENGADA